MGKFREELADWAMAILGCVPGRIGVLLRRGLLTPFFESAGAKFAIARGAEIRGLRSITLGKDISFDQGAFVSAVSGKLRIGDRLRANRGAFIVADGGEIRIGKDVLIAMGCILRASNHRIDGLPAVPIQDQGHVAGVIEIGDGVWLGAGVTVLPGARIGRNSVIGAGAVVSGEIPEGSLAVGVPAVVKKSLY